MFLSSFTLLLLGESKKYQNEFWSSHFYQPYISSSLITRFASAMTNFKYLHSQNVGTGVLIGWIYGARFGLYSTFNVQLFLCCARRFFLFNVRTSLSITNRFCFFNLVLHNFFSYANLFVWYSALSFNGFWNKGIVYSAFLRTRNVRIRRRLEKKIPSDFRKELVNRRYFLKKYPIGVIFLNNFKFFDVHNEAVQMGAVTCGFIGPKSVSLYTRAGFFPLFACDDFWIPFYFATMCFRSWFVGFLRFLRLRVIKEFFFFFKKINFFNFSSFIRLPHKILNSKFSLNFFYDLCIFFFFYARSLSLFNEFFNFMQLFSFLPQNVRRKFRWWFTKFLKKVSKKWSRLYQVFVFEKIKKKLRYFFYYKSLSFFFFKQQLNFRLKQLWFLIYFFKRLDKKKLSFENLEKFSKSYKFFNCLIFFRFIVECFRLPLKIFQFATYRTLYFFFDFTRIHWFFRRSSISFYKNFFSLFFKFTLYFFFKTLKKFGKKKLYLLSNNLAYKVSKRFFFVKNRNFNFFFIKIFYVVTYNINFIFNFIFFFKNKKPFEFFFLFFFFIKERVNIDFSFFISKNDSFLDIKNFELANLIVFRQQYYFFFWVISSFLVILFLYSFFFFSFFFSNIKINFVKNFFFLFFRKQLIYFIDKFCLVNKTIYYIYLSFLKAFLFFPNLYHFESQAWRYKFSNFFLNFFFRRLARTKFYSSKKVCMFQPRFLLNLFCSKVYKLRYPVPYCKLFYKYHLGLIGSKYEIFEVKTREIFESFRYSLLSKYFFRKVLNISIKKNRKKRMKIKKFIRKLRFFFFWNGFISRASTGFFNLQLYKFQIFSCYTLIARKATSMHVFYSWTKHWKSRWLSKMLRYFNKRRRFLFFSNVLSNKHFLVDSFKSSDINVSNSLKGKAYIKKSSRKLYNRFMYWFPALFNLRHKKVAKTFNFLFKYREKWRVPAVHLRRAMAWFKAEFFKKKKPVYWAYSWPKRTPRMNNWKIKILSNIRFNIWYKLSQSFKNLLKIRKGYWKFWNKGPRQIVFDKRMYKKELFSKGLKFMVKFIKRHSTFFWKGFKEIFKHFYDDFRPYYTDAIKKLEKSSQTSKRYFPSFFTYLFVLNDFLEKEDEFCLNFYLFGSIHDSNPLKKKKKKNLQILWKKKKKY